MLPPDSAPPPPPPRRAQAVELWAGVARHSPRLGVLGSTADMSLALAAVRYTRRLRERPRGRVQPTLGFAGGFLYFDRREPTTSAARFNFTAALEAGLRVEPARGPGASLTYRLHHISNGGTAPDNFAVASHVLSAGVRWRVGR